MLHAVLISCLQYGFMHHAVFCVNALFHLCIALIKPTVKVVSHSLPDTLDGTVGSKIIFHGLQLLGTRSCLLALLYVLYRVFTHGLANVVHTQQLRQPLFLRLQRHIGIIHRWCICRVIAHTVTGIHALNG